MSMPVHDILFWIAIMVAVFILLLGIQLRFFGGMGLRIYVADKLKQASREEVQAIIAAAVGGPRAPHTGSDMRNVSALHAAGAPPCVASQ